MRAKACITPLLVSVGMLLSSIALGGSPTFISGNQSGTLYLTNSPYIVTSDIVVPSGQTLTIEAGVEVQFTNFNIGAFVDGTLIARGTAGTPILFTSDKVTKQPGQWKVLCFRSGFNSVLENCIIECGAGLGSGFVENVRVESFVAPLLTNCIFRLASGNGLTVYGGDPRIQNCAFNNNTNLAIAMRTDSLPILQGNSASGNGRNSIGIFGYYISRSGTWTRDNIPYTIYEEALVNPGVTLTIEPGTVVQFERTFDGLYIDGTLVARGTAANPISFTSDDAVKQPGQWRAIQFRATAGVSSIMENCIVEYGATAAGGFNGSLQFDGAPAILITNCTVRDSTYDGIFCNGSSPLIRDCRITNNSRDGLRTFNGSNPIITGSVLSGNLGFGVNNLDTTRIISAEGNYWGHPSGPLDNSNADGLGLSNPGGLGDKVNEYVDWSPFLNVAPTNSEAPAVLAISRVGNQVTVSWPSGATGYSLQTITNLSLGSNSWAAVTNVPVLISDRYTISESLAGLRKFYRLIK